MTRTPGIVFALVTLAAAVPSAKAGGTANIKCAPNEDRVWVYESLTDFNVAAKLKCGEAGADCRARERLRENRNRQWHRRIRAGHLVPKIGAASRAS